MTSSCVGHLSQGCLYVHLGLPTKTYQERSASKRELNDGVKARRYSEVFQLVVPYSDNFVQERFFPSIQLQHLWRNDKCTINLLLLL